MALVQDADVQDKIDRWVARQDLSPWLAGHVAAVVSAMATEARDDLLGDTGLRVTEFDPRRASVVPISAPAARRPARAVALKQTLRQRPERFVRWVVAHELAHVYLRNRGRTPEEDPEHAADALAEAWGFPRPG